MWAERVQRSQRNSNSNGVYLATVTVCIWGRGEGLPEVRGRLWQGEFVRAQLRLRKKDLHNVVSCGERSCAEGSCKHGWCVACERGRRGLVCGV
eukprot:359633-Chlamydomonas_euryale.AAC.1